VGPSELLPVNEQQFGKDIEGGVKSEWLQSPVVQVCITFLPFFQLWVPLFFHP